MPNPIRLSILIEMREAIGLTQADAAELCGLAGRQSRKTLAAWELGQSTPRQRFRLPFAVYLLRDLKLSQDLARFDTIFEMLTEEWGWPPLEADERADCLRAAQVASGRVALSPVTDSPDPAANAKKVASDTDRGAKDRSWRTRTKLLPVLGGLVVLAILAIFASRFSDRSALNKLPVPASTPPAVVLAPSSSPISPTSTPQAFANGSFEAGLAPWYPVEDGECPLELINDSTQARAGDTFLRIVDPGEGCISLRQDFGQLMGGVVHVAFYVRSLHTHPTRGTLSLSAIQNRTDESAQQRAIVHFKLQDKEWHCVETVGTLNQSGDKMLRAELSFDPAQGELDVDDVKIGFGDGVLCPPQSPKLQGGDFEYDGTASAWHWFETPCHFAVIRGKEWAYSGENYLSVQRTPDCNSFYQDVTVPSFGRDQAYTLSLYVRGPLTQTLQGRIALHAMGTGLSTETEGTPFIAGPEWRCIQAVLPAVDRGYNKLRGEIYLDSLFNEGAYAFDSIQLSVGADPGCSSQSMALINPGFELNPNFPIGWKGGNLLCDLQVIADKTAAFDGAAFLEVRRGNDDCISVFQDVVARPSPGETVRGGVWLRGSGVDVNLVLRAMDGPNGAEWTDNPVTLSGNGWQCVEVAHRVEREGHQLLRLELYLNTPGDLPYQIDGAQLRRNAETLCPQTDLALRNALFEPDTDFSYPAGSVGTATIAHNWGATEAPAGLLAFWLSDAPNGAPLDPALVKQSHFPALKPGTSTSTLFGEGRVPAELPPGDYFVVWDLPPIAGVVDTRPDNNRFSLPIRIRPCETGTVYCDVPSTYWAFNEIELWHRAGITNGCRSGTTPYQDRPFCPDLMTNRSELTVFFLRSLNGGDFTPTGNFEGTFADVFIDMAHNRGYWIEAFHQLGVDVSTERCAPSGSDEIYFCPDLLLTRRELLLYLAQAQGWELSPVQGDLFSDIGEEIPANRAIEYAARQAILAPGDPFCPPLPTGPRFCPDEPARRAFVAAVMVRAFASESEQSVSE